MHYGVIGPKIFGTKTFFSARGLDPMELEGIIEIFMSLLLFWSAFLVLLLLAVKRSRRTTKLDLKCPEQGLEK